MRATPLTPELLRQRPDLLAALHAAARHERADVVSALMRQWWPGTPAPRVDAVRTGGCG